ncbi:MAG: outer membrane beta-barrel protein [Pirellulaceae bacterium]|nr:outer membrane beta-barrel protein [Pirellulaceae bacterium]
MPLSLRAETPLNPLRQSALRRVSPDPVPAPAPRPAARPDVFAEVPASEIRQVVATEDLPPPDPPTVVPPQFGEPANPYGGPRYGYLPSDAPGDIVGGPPHDGQHQPWFTHGDPNDPYRHVGLGEPLIGTSWLNRPWYFGAFLGAMLADDPIRGEVLSNNSYFVGSRLGWDFDHYWGFEGRYAFSKPQINNAADIALDGPSRNYYLDVSVAYYPWGDSRWRPFGTIGLGVQTFRFDDENGTKVHQSLLSLPLGIGFKYLHSPVFDMRFEAYDNIAFGDGRLDTMNNFTLMVGGELRFGGRVKHYFPWHGNIAGW